MQNDFLPYEDDFQLWVAGGFAPCEPATADYLRFLADPEDERQPRADGLWPHQWEALLRIVYAREVGKRSLWGGGVLTNIVTGGGKTALIAATMVWLRLAHEVERFLVLCPNLIVRDRLEEDFRGGKVFEERGLIPPHGALSAADFSLTTLGGRQPAGAVSMLGEKIVLANIHQFYESNRAGQQNLFSFLTQDQTPFAVFNDEAHNTPAPQYDRTLRMLNEHGAMRFRLDTTATPERADDEPIDSAMIYEYDIPAALNDGVIATPVVYQPSIETVELTYTDALSGKQSRVEEIDWDEVDRAGVSATQWVTDAKPMSQQISIAINRLNEARRNAAGRYRPILFVVAVCKADARAAQAMLADQFGLRALLVTEDSEEQARKDAAGIAHEHKYDAVVSVAMLREGWDVPEVAVVLPLRKMGSKVYAPQIIGRGLRRVRRADIAAEEPQICAVVDHPKLEHGWLWDLLRARVRENVGVDEQFDEQDELPEPPPRQEIVEPELLIKVPEPNDEDDAFEPVDVGADDEPSRSWRELLDELEYPRELVEITDQQIAEVTARELKPRGWTKHVGAPSDGAAGAAPELSDADLAESVRERVRELAARATEQHGYAAIEQRYVYRAALRHVSEQFLGGDDVGFAERADLYRALGALGHLDGTLMRRGDIVGGMIEYGAD